MPFPMRTARVERKERMIPDPTLPTQSSTMFTGAVKTPGKVLWSFSSIIEAEQNISPDIAVKTSQLGNIPSAKSASPFFSIFPSINRSMGSS